MGGKAGTAGKALRRKLVARRMGFFQSVRGLGRGAAPVHPSSPGRPQQTTKELLEGRSGQAPSPPHPARSAPCAPCALCGDSDEGWWRRQAPLHCGGRAKTQPGRNASFTKIGPVVGDRSARGGRCSPSGARLAARLVGRVGHGVGHGVGRATVQSGRSPKFAPPGCSARTLRAPPRQAADLCAISRPLLPPQSGLRGVPRGSLKQH